MIHISQPKTHRTTSDSTPSRLHPPSTDLSSTGSDNLFESAPLINDLVTDQVVSDQFNFELAQRILKRIETRLPGRIRHLTVFTTENAVVLAGHCCTFYSKQLAQHAAMGALDFERLINNIDVRVPK